MYAADSPKRKYDLYFTLNPNWSPRTGGTSEERAAYTCPIINAQAIRNRYDYIHRVKGNIYNHWKMIITALSNMLKTDTSNLFFLLLRNFIDKCNPQRGKHFSRETLAHDQGRVSVKQRNTSRQ